MRGHLSNLGDHERFLVTFSLDSGRAAIALVGRLMGCDDGGDVACNLRGIENRAADAASVVAMRPGPRLCDDGDFARVISSLEEMLAALTAATEFFERRRLDLNAASVQAQMRALQDSLRVLRAMDQPFLFPAGAINHDMIEEGLRAALASAETMPGDDQDPPPWDEQIENKAA